MNHNIDVEQALIGAALLDNDALLKVGAKPHHFYDPVHARIWATILDLHADQRTATPTTLRHLLEDDDGLREIGGPGYLARLMGAAVSIASAPEYSRIIVDLWARRATGEALEQAKVSLAADGAAVTPAAVSDALLASIAEIQQDAAVRPVVHSWTSSLLKAVQAANDGYQGEGMAGLSTGITDLDRVLGGLFPGDLMVLAGRPSMGKTAVALTMAVQAAMAGQPVILASLEMGREQLAMRFLSSALSAKGIHTPYSRIRRGALSEDEMRAVVETSNECRNLPLYVIEQECRSIPRLQSAVAQAARQCKGPALIVVDYLQLIEVPGARTGYDRVTAASSALKGMAIRHEAPLIALSQLSRQVESRDDKRPRMDDLRESGAIEQDADSIVMCYRDEYYLQREEPKAGDSKKVMDWSAAMDAARGALELLVVKNRHGTIDTARARFDAPTNTISSWEEDRPAPQQLEILEPDPFA